MRRRRIGKRHSRKMFTKHAKRVHPRNVRPVAMRGGYRL